nr:hypothetical protein [Mimivirus sp.]
MTSTQVTEPETNEKQVFDEVPEVVTLSDKQDDSPYSPKSGADRLAKLPQNVYDEFKKLSYGQAFGAFVDRLHNDVNSENFEHYHLLWIKIVYNMCISFQKEIFMLENQLLLSLMILRGAFNKLLFLMLFKHLLILLNKMEIPKILKIIEKLIIIVIFTSLLLDCIINVMAHGVLLNQNLVPEDKILVPDTILNQVREIMVNTHEVPDHILIKGIVVIMMNKMMKKPMLIILLVLVDLTNLIVRLGLAQNVQNAQNVQKDQNVQRELKDKILLQKRDPTPLDIKINDLLIQKLLDNHMFLKLINVQLQIN